MGKQALPPLEGDNQRLGASARPSGEVSEMCSSESPAVRNKLLQGILQMVVSSL